MRCLEAKRGKWQMGEEQALMRFLKSNFAGIKEDEIKSVSKIKIQTLCGKR
jgi:hypothetical protein